MAVAVDRKRSQPRSRPQAFPSLLGDGMPERLRSTSIALLGIVAAVGLGTVALALQLGLPSVVSGPLPQPPPQRHAVAERVPVEEKAAAEATAEPVAESGASSLGADGSPLPSQSSPSMPVAHEPSEGAVLVTGSPPAQSRPERRSPPRPSLGQSPSAEEAAPATPPPVEPSASASEVPPPPEPAPVAPTPTHPGNGNAYGKGIGNGVGNGGEPPGQVAKAARQGEAGQ